MAGRDGPPPSAADDLPDLVAEAHAAQLQFVSSLPAAGHGGHGGGARGSTLGLGDGGRGSTRGRGSHGTGRGRAQGGGPGQGDGQPLGRGRPVPGDVQGDGPPLGSSRAGQPSGHGDDAQHAAAGDPNHPFRASRPATTNQTKKKMNESDSMDWNDEYIALVFSVT
ncbi:hypothetical protein PVAP13_6NG035300 [Panicum virgatum]|uniref:Uncharacterized protein n=1 Tax=Panicum virgatum TaxID=38727 RepID=A0A8T0QUC1_PANVG|nr:hypothetical protein PVAP13_6NG035300 [Panicum virgatum]